MRGRLFGFANILLSGTLTPPNTRQWCEGPSESCDKCLAAVSQDVRGEGSVCTYAL